MYLDQVSFFDIDNVSIYYCQPEIFLSEIDSLFTILSHQELIKISNFKQKNRQNLAIIYRSLLKIILANHLKINPQDIEFSYTIKGKPFLTNSALNFNLSHTEDMVIYAISEKIIGIDIEKNDKILKHEELAERFFCPSEYQLIKQINQDKKAELFYQFWTAKEAFLKATGEGLSGGLNTMELGYDLRRRAPVILSNNIRQTWHLETLNINANYCCNLVIAK
ncbi:MAG: 4'-phosphopantetheinyl transferase superfamily protein [Cyanobacterium sp. T60_A2020_053]|nr:4'-phosphopantetheinyl transferase superfamily protein [Cyanobacterium sp. T60_A2020_053]